MEAIEGGDSGKAVIAGSRALGTLVDESGKVLAARPDGLVREVIGKQVISREEVNELTETEERKALGDFSDEVSAFGSIPDSQRDVNRNGKTRIANFIHCM